MLVHVAADHLGNAYRCAFSHWNRRVLIWFIPTPRFQQSEAEIHEQGLFFDREGTSVWKCSEIVSGELRSSKIIRPLVKPDCLTSESARFAGGLKPSQICFTPQFGLFSSPLPSLPVKQTDFFLSSNFTIAPPHIPSWTRS